jgi:hypothetical protein
MYSSVPKAETAVSSETSIFPTIFVCLHKESVYLFAFLFIFNILRHGCPYFDYMWYDGTEIPEGGFRLLKRCMGRFDSKAVYFPITSPVRYI